MGKDPAFLFYPNDYLGGTMGMTFEERGAYVHLLMMQFNRGHMTFDMIGQEVGQVLGREGGQILSKFTVDSDGMYYNERLEKEKRLREEFTASRKNNLEGKNQYTNKSGHKENHMDGHATSHVEDEDVNENKDKKESEERKEKIPYKEIVDYLNLKNGTEYKDTTKETRRCIQARFKEGFTLENFYTVIETRVEKWKGTEWQDYLRPETLFGNKFEGYLNQKQGKAAGYTSPTHTGGSSYKL